MRLIRIEFGVAVELPTGDAMPIRHIIGIGRNYARHASEQGLEAPDRPMIFTKNPASAILDGDEIVIPPICRDPATGGDQVDYEAELGVLIGRSARDVSEGEALEHVLGYCCANDVSARWWQKQGSGGQFCRCKSFDTFCPVGPSLVPAGEIPDPQSLGIRCMVNGEVRQESETGQMSIPVGGLIAELSVGTTLLPGTLILTGTPAGVGMARTPPAFLQDGDEVQVWIERIGTLCNRVRCA